MPIGIKAYSRCRGRPASPMWSGPATATACSGRRWRWHHQDPAQPGCRRQRRLHRRQPQTVSPSSVRLPPTGATRPNWPMIRSTRRSWCSTSTADGNLGLPPLRQGQRSRPSCGTVTLPGVSSPVRGGRRLVSGDPGLAGDRQRGASPAAWATPPCRRTAPRCWMARPWPISSGQLVAQPPAGLSGGRVQPPGGAGLRGAPRRHEASPMPCGRSAATTAYCAAATCPMVGRHRRRAEAGVDKPAGSTPPSTDRALYFDGVERPRHVRPRRWSTISRSRMWIKTTLSGIGTSGGRAATSSTATFKG